MKHRTPKTARERHVGANRRDGGSINIQYNHETESVRLAALICHTTKESNVAELPRNPNDDVWLSCPTLRYLVPATSRSYMWKERNCVWFFYSYYKVHLFFYFKKQSHALSSTFGQFYNVQERKRDRDPHNSHFLSCIFISVHIDTSKFGAFWFLESVFRHEPTVGIWSVCCGVCVAVSL